MKKSLVLCVVFLSIQAFAVSKGSRITRGGFGFLYPDHNSFLNPGQFAIERGLAVEATFETESTTSQQTAVPSAVFGNGSFGIGLFNERSGTSVTTASTSTDLFGGGIGLALANERLTIGVGVERPIDEAPTSNGKIKGTITLNAAKRAGFSMGAGFASTLSQVGGDVMSGTLAMGYGSSTVSFEVLGDFKNLNDFTDSELGAFFNWQTSAVYFASGYLRGLTTESNTFKGRLGFVMGSLDLSGFIAYPLEASDNLSFGGSLRLAI